jgi:hypothetical protein
VDPENKAGAAAAIGFSMGLPLALASMFWGLNFLPVVIAMPAMIHGESRPSCAHGPAAFSVSVEVRLGRYFWPSEDGVGSELGVSNPWLEPAFAASSFGAAVASCELCSMSVACWDALSSSA